MCSEEDLEEAQAWIKKFCDEHPAKYEAEDVPIKIIMYYINTNEIPGACMHWGASYLQKLECPLNLSIVIIYHISQEVVLLDIAQNFTQHDTEDGAQTVATEVARCVFNKVHEVCHRWKTQLENFKSMPYFVQEFMIDDKTLFAGAFCDQNRRRKMEDRHIVIPNLMNLLQLEGPSVSYYAVYDGHGGMDAVVYALQHLHLYIAKSQHFPTDILKALEEGYLATDKQFVAKATREGLKSGTTSVVVMLTDNSLYVGWAGDSQAILCRKSTYIQIMEAHKPERDDEKKRIEDLGGGTPDIKQILLDGSEDFVILACDGLWDVIPPWQAVEIVVDYVKEYGVDAHKAAKWLLSQAIELGSQDNVTVVVVFFENGPLVTSCRPPKEEPSMVFPIPIAVTPEAQAILERLDRSVRGTQDSPEPPASRATAEVN